MPYAINGDVNIYYQIKGEGTPLKLTHGATADLTFWRRYGYADVLKFDDKLILFNPGGHK